MTTIAEPEQTYINGVWTCKGCGRQLKIPGLDESQLPLKSQCCRPRLRYNDVINTPCVHIGDVIDKVQCVSCKGMVYIKKYRCNLHEECTLQKRVGHTKVCKSCPDYSIEQPKFISTDQLVRDTQRLLAQIPTDLSGVVGIPRSGMVPATIVAMSLHLPLFTYTHNNLFNVGSGARLNVRSPALARMIVIDDTVCTGNTIKRAKKFFGTTAHYAAVYVRPNYDSAVDFYADKLNLPHFLEWNLFNSIHIAKMAFDMDGVLCEDFSEDIGDDEKDMLNRRPLYLPRKEKIPLIITARMERHRDVTEAWLDKHGVQYDRLVMGSWKTEEERLRPHEIARYKSAHFANSGLVTYVESHPSLAKQIAQMTRRQVICPTIRAVY